MTAKNDITGDPIRSKPSSEYSKNYDAIDWGNKAADAVRDLIRSRPKAPNTLTDAERQEILDELAKDSE